MWHDLIGISGNIAFEKVTLNLARKTGLVCRNCQIFDSLISIYEMFVEYIKIWFSTTNYYLLVNFLFWAFKL